MGCCDTRCYAMGWAAYLARDSLTFHCGCSVGWWPSHCHQELAKALGLSLILVLLVPLPDRAIPPVL